ncbi:MAG TPA: PepSY domain-containing protein [Albitalea sp.]|nr:PepSY domain-containing protein [Albitalea sp.]
MNRIAIAAVAATALTLAGVATYAANEKENDALGISSARTSLAQAVAAAENKVQGKAARAEFEQAKGGKWVFDVEVVAGAKVFDVSVDADTGAVIAATEDRSDHDDARDEKD